MSSLPPVPPSTSAGWYADPWHQASWRWWDGTTWSAQTSADAPSATERKPRLPGWLSWPVFIATPVALALTGIVVVFAPLASVLSMVPLLFVLPAVRWLDRVEPEPRAAKLHAVLWGATVAVVASVVVNTTVAVSSSLEIAAVVSAPLIEELTKGLAVIWAVRRREIDSVLDGIVYAGLAGIGFAVVENVQYLGSLEGGALVQVFVIRALLSPFAHPMFTMWIGIMIGLAVVKRKPLFPAFLAGWALSAICHAAWNGSLVAVGETGNIAYLGVAILAFVSLFIGSVIVLVRVRRRAQSVFTSSIPMLGQRYGFSPHEIGVFADWKQTLRTRKQLPKSERARFDRTHSALARLSELHARGDVDPVDEQRLAAQLHATRA